MVTMLEPLDIVVLDGKWWIPYHWPIMWRGLDRAVHTVMVVRPDGLCVDPSLFGVKQKNIKSYSGRHATVLRYNKPYDRNAVMQWCLRTSESAEGYDFVRQWLLGFVLGLNSSIADDEHRWTCSEFPYWAFQDNGYTLTRKPERLPMPRLFRYHPDFSVVFEGTL